MVARRLFWWGSALVGAAAIVAGGWEFALLGYWRLLAAGSLVLLCLVWTWHQRRKDDGL